MPLERKDKKDAVNSSLPCNSVRTFRDFCLVDDCDPFSFYRRKDRKCYSRTSLLTGGAIITNYDLLSLFSPVLYSNKISTSLGVGRVYFEKCKDLNIGYMGAQICHLFTARLKRTVLYERSLTFSNCA